MFSLIKKLNILIICDIGTEHYYENITTNITTEKISSMRDWPISQNKKHLRSFFVFCSYYRKFVREFSSYTKPLYIRTEKLGLFGRKNVKFIQWIKAGLNFFSSFIFPKVEFLMLMRRIKELGQFYHKNKLVWKM